MTLVNIKEAYAQVLQPLESSIEAAVRQLAIERANQGIAELQRKARVWGNRYQCSFDLFAFRTATDEQYIESLNKSAETSLWEADLNVWEFYAEELDEWYRHLQDILTA